MTIFWTPAMETGIHQIDTQHRELVNIINEMNSAHTNDQSSSALNEILPRLSIYALFHFAEEEALMSQVAEGTTFAELHEQEHQAFVEEIKRLVGSRGQQSDEELAEVLTLYLSDWLVLHITGTDRALGRMLSAKSIS
jgi:hemerythrin